MLQICNMMAAAEVNACGHFLHHLCILKAFMQACVRASVIHFGALHQAWNHCAYQSLCPRAFRLDARPEGLITRHVLMITIANLCSSSSPVLSSFSNLQCRAEGLHLHCSLTLLRLSEYALCWSFCVMSSMTCSGAAVTLLTSKTSQGCNVPESADPAAGHARAYCTHPVATSSAWNESGNCQQQAVLSWEHISILHWL